jgi:hypothetical protein
MKMDVSSLSGSSYRSMAVLRVTKFPDHRIK